MGSVSRFMLARHGTNAKFYQIGSGSGSSFGEMPLDRCGFVWMEMARNKHISGTTGKLQKALDGQKNFRDVGVAGSNPVTPTIEFRVLAGHIADDFGQSATRAAERLPERAPTRSPKPA